MLGRIKALILDIRHGLSLKIFALGSRGVFLFVVVPRLAPGELSKYVFFSTIAALCARAISMGMEEQLPLRIAGKRSTATFFAPLIGLATVVEIVFAFSFISTGHFFAVTALLTSCYVTTSLFAGLLRSVNVSASERLRDLHWLVFGLICLIPVPWRAEQLIGLLAVSLMSVHLLEYCVSGIRVSLRGVDWDSLWRQTKLQVDRAWRKLLASLSMIADVRGLVLWPGLLGLGLNLDSIAYSLLLGEAFWQTTAVLVYRRYAYYCALGPEDSDRIKKDSLYSMLVLVLYAAIAAGAVAAFNLTGIEIGEFSDWNAVATMILFFGVMSCYYLLRYVTWVLKDFDWVLMGLEVVLILAQGLLVMKFPMDSWIIGLLILSIVFISIVLVYVFRFVKPVSVTTEQLAG